MEKKKILIAYFSWSGNTRKIAIQIQKLLGGDIFEIKAAKDYSDVYSDVVSKAREEKRLGLKPTLKNKFETLANYSTIFIGYPNWCNTFPAPVLSFLSEYDFSEKTIIPFCTHGGGGIGHSFTDISRNCANSKVTGGFSINGYAVSNHNFEVEDWMEEIEGDIIL